MTFTHNLANQKFVTKTQLNQLALMHFPDLSQNQSLKEKVKNQFRKLYLQHVFEKHHNCVPNTVTSIGKHANFDCVLVILLICKNFAKIK